MRLTLTLGWLANIPLDENPTYARFTGAPDRSLFNMRAFNRTTNQLIIGAEFSLKEKEGLSLLPTAKPTF